MRVALSTPGLIAAPLLDIDGSISHNDQASELKPHRPDQPEPEDLEDADV